MLSAIARKAEDALSSRYVHIISDHVAAIAKAEFARGTNGYFFGGVCE